MNKFQMQQNYVSFIFAVCVLVAQLCPTLCNPMECNSPGYSVHGFLQARILEWVDISSSRGSFQPRDWTWVSHVAGRFFTIWVTRSSLLWVTEKQSPRSASQQEAPCFSVTRFQSWATCAWQRLKCKTQLTLQKAAMKFQDTIDSKICLLWLSMATKCIR